MRMALPLSLSFFAPATFAAFSAFSAVVAGCSSYTLATSKPTGLAAFGPSATFPQRVGQVCVFRPHPAGPPMTTAILDDGKLVGATKGAGYFCYLAAPGQHQIVAEDGDAEPANVGVEAGKRYFLHHEINLGADRFEWIDAARARLFATECAYTRVVDAPADEPLPTDQPVAPALAVVGQ